MIVYMMLLCEKNIDINLLNDMTLFELYIS